VEVCREGKAEGDANQRIYQCWMPDREDDAPEIFPFEGDPQWFRKLLKNSDVDPFGHIAVHRNPINCK